MLLWCGGAVEHPAASAVPKDGGATFSEGGARDAVEWTVDFPVPACTAREGCKGGFCLVPAGTFTMGSPPGEFGRGRNTEEQTSVTYTHSIVLQQTEVTQAQWEGMGFPNLAGTLDDGAGGTDCVGPECPASTMTWCEAVEFANQLSQREGRTQCMKLVNPRGSVGRDFECDGISMPGETYYDCDGYRIPTSGEREHATRAGTTTAFFSGAFEDARDTCYDLPHLSRVAWYCANSGGRTHPVCTRDANPWGLFDMHGNAAEFTVEQSQHGYGPGPVTDPPIASGVGFDPSFRLVRDAPWLALPTYLRAASQSFTVSTASKFGKRPGQGFRLARTLGPAEAASW